MLQKSVGSWRARIASRMGVPLALVGLVTGFSPLTATVAAHAGAMQTYIVLYSASAVPADAAASLAKAGGTLLYSYPQIGVAIARSDSADFRANVVKDARVDGAAATAGFATKLTDDPAAAGDASATPSGPLPNARATDADTFSALQWDLRQIHAPDAHAITGGSRSVLVGDIDTGIDFNHPDLRQNIDVADSANCLSGAPVQGLAAQDDNGHGTHTAGTIAAASNGIGIVGVAPNVRIAAIKAGTGVGGFFFPEAVVCAFMWAGTHHVNVTNNSYFADPFLFNCKNDPVQRAIWKAEQRAIKFAMQQGTVVVAAEGNQADDLSHPTLDSTSPDNVPTPLVRTVHNDCVVIPVEIPGVIGVTADARVRHAFEDAFVAKLRAAGVDARPSYPVLPEINPVDPTQLRKAVQAADVDGVLAAKLVKIERDPNGLQEFSFENRSAGFYEYYGAASDGSFDPTAGGISNLITIHFDLYSVAGSQLVWGGDAATYPSPDVKGVTDGLAYAVIRTLKDQKLI